MYMHFKFHILNESILVFIFIPVITFPSFIVTFRELFCRFDLVVQYFINII